MRIYEKVHLVVATPGRILDLMEKQVCNTLIVRCLHITIFFSENNVYGIVTERGTPYSY